MDCAGGVLRDGAGIERGRIGVDAATGLHKCRCDQANDKSERCDRLEVEERLKADASQSAKVREEAADYDACYDSDQHAEVERLEKIL